MQLRSQVRTKKVLAALPAVALVLSGAAAWAVTGADDPNPTIPSTPTVPGAPALPALPSAPGLPDLGALPALPIRTWTFDLSGVTFAGAASRVRRPDSAGTEGVTRPP